MTRLAIVPRWSGGASSDWYPWIREELERDPGPSSPPALARRPTRMKTERPTLERAETEWRTALPRSLDVEILELPNKDAPVIEQCVAALTRALGDDVEALRDTILVGHSVGCQALLRYLAELAPAPASSSTSGRLGAPGPRQLVCVAGWWTVDEPWPSIRPWIDTVHDLPRLRANTASGVTVLLSEDDPFTRDWRENKTTWEQRLDADVRVVPDGRHFNATQEPAVLGLIRGLL